jgi:hypothetical protein
MGAGAGNAPPTPGVMGSGLGSLAQMKATAPAQQPNYQPMRPLQPAAPLKPVTPSMGKALLPGQAAFPVGQTPWNPWGSGRGGSGTLPLYRRPGTMPGTTPD